MRSRSVQWLCVLAVAVGLAGCGGAAGGDAELGAWRFRAAGSSPWVPVAVPGLARGPQRYGGGTGTWRASLTVRRTGLYEIDVGSANRVATGFVDGRRVCSHVGAYEPFSCTARLGAGRHAFELRLEWRDPRRARRQGYDRGWFNWGGLAWPVTVRRVGALDLARPRVWTHLLAGGGARVMVTVDVTGAAASVRGTLRRGGDAVALRFGPVSRAHRTVTARVVIPRPALWSPAHPNLYDLEVRAPGAAPVRLRVGLRELSWSAAGLRLNGRRVRLRGATLPPDAQGHGDALTPADEARIVAELGAVGADAARSQLPLSDSMLARLDAAGILVWQEVGPFTRAGDWHGDPASARHRALATALREQPHPSVVAWSLVNEAAGQGRPNGQVEYVRTTASALHEADPGRPVVAGIWGAHPPRAPGPMYAPLDGLAVTDYVGWYDDVGVPPAAQDRLALGRLQALRALFPGKLVVVGELGAAANARTPGTARGSFAYQAALLLRRIAAYRGDDVFVFSLRDYALRPGFTGGRAAALGFRGTPGINDKGLFDLSGRPKPAAGAVRAAFLRGS